MNHKVRMVVLFVLAISSAARADEDLQVPHMDPLTRDPALTLREVVDATFRQYPQGSLIAALDEEAKALHRRSDSLVAGYPMIYLQWIDDRVMNDRGEVQIQTGYQVPFWMWNQRSASRSVAEDADKATSSFAAAVKHEVAGLVRDALWNLELVQNRREMAQ
ncbi:MAG: TolC family protein, partial [Methylococcaceae bacterium]|nr:TolC family protein [Methylococcaceae bacterium]